MSLPNYRYIEVMNAFIAHWGQCNSALAPGTPLRVQLPNKTLVLRAGLEEVRERLLAKKTDVLEALTDWDLARGLLEETKVKLLERFNQFITKLDSKWQNSHFITARPYAPSLRDGQEQFSRPMGKMMTLWEKINAGPAPAGVTLPLVLPETPNQPGVTMTQGEFASLLSALQFQFLEQDSKEQDVVLVRQLRDEVQDEAYVILVSYRENVPGDLMAFPALVATMPRLSPLPGHTPVPVNVTATFEAPDQAKIVYSESTDPTLYRYQLRGHVGTEWDEDYAEVIANNDPAAPREFVSNVGLGEPGVHMVYKVYVILTTDNEAGSAPVVVQRPFSAVA